MDSDNFEMTSSRGAPGKLYFTAFLLFIVASVALSVWAFVMLW